MTAQGESGPFQNHFYANTTGPADTIPPTIVRMEQVEDTTDTDGPYVVRVTIADGVTSDRGFFDRGVTLHWRVDGQEFTAPMHWSGNSIWRGEIPGQADGTVVTYWVSAIDWANNEGVGAELDFLVGSIPGDLDGNGAVDFSDLLAVLAAWGPCVDCPADFDDSGAVDFADLLVILSNWTS